MTEVACRSPSIGSFVGWNSRACFIRYTTQTAQQAFVQRENVIYLICGKGRGLGILHQTYNIPHICCFWVVYYYKIYIKKRVWVTIFLGLTVGWMDAAISKASVPILSCLLHFSPFLSHFLQVTSCQEGGNRKVGQETSNETNLDSGRLIIV